VKRTSIQDSAIQKQLLKKFTDDVSAILTFTNEKMFTLTTPKNPQNDRLYAYPSTKNKDIVTKPLRTQSSFRVTDGISRRVADD